MTNPLAPQVAVVAALLARFSLSNEPELGFARDQLAQAVRLAQTNTAAYNIPLDQAFPDGVGFETIAVYVNPVNVGAALLTLTNAAQRSGFQLAVDPTLQVYTGGAWQTLAGTLLPQVPVNITASPAPPPQAAAPVQAAPPPPPPAPAPAPAPAAPPAAPTTAQDLSGLVQSVLAEPAPAEQPVAPSTVAATPMVATPASAPAPTPPTPEQLQALFPQGVQTADDLNLFTGLRNGTVSYDDAVAARDASPTNTEAALPPPPTAAPPAPVAPPQPSASAPEPAGGSAPTASAPANHGRPADDERLPDSSVLAQRTGASGRPQKSPFEGKIAERSKVAAAPYWWDHMRYSAKHVLAVNPAQALDPSSTGAAPVQSYAMLITLLQDVFKPLDPHTTVAEIRTFLREVETGMLGLESAKAVFQLCDALFGEPDKTTE